LRTQIIQRVTNGPDKINVLAVADDVETLGDVSTDGTPAWCRPVCDYPSISFHVWPQPQDTRPGFVARLSTLQASDRDPASTRDGGSSMAECASLSAYMLCRLASQTGLVFE
jgi:hypothetical protein